MTAGQLHVAAGVPEVSPVIWAEMPPVSAGLLLWWVCLLAHISQVLAGVSAGMPQGSSIAQWSSVGR